MVSSCTAGGQFAALSFPTKEMKNGSEVRKNANKVGQG